MWQSFRMMAEMLERIANNLGTLCDEMKYLNDRLALLDRRMADKMKTNDKETKVGLSD